MVMQSSDLVRPKKLSIAITFHFSEERLLCLTRVASQFHLLADEISVWVVTNTTNRRQHEQIRSATSDKIDVQIAVPELLLTGATLRFLDGFLTATVKSRILCT